MQNVNKQHIVLLSSYLHVPGGYEKIVVNLTNLFAQSGFSVTLLVLDKAEGVFYPLAPAVRLVQKPLLLVSAQREIWSQEKRPLSEIFIHCKKSCGN